MPVRLSKLVKIIESATVAELEKETNAFLETIGFAYLPDVQYRPIQTVMGTLYTAMIFFNSEDGLKQSDFLQ
ncbi:hypothetical protein LX99_00021 [Mucilaginibacter oryzae]|uniref:Uncharacterized protein n=1 Tax=Mucilaginibacter oryzae TaxID=468058 RepID=A0A316HEF8_9SPHI|nr:hypothetical protein [Mucilaginibacter oryzae]PWK79564.1 hypothetical protein LX99_00021 [Mucilaginibacter oryzae]